MFSNVLDLKQNILVCRSFLSKTMCLGLIYYGLILICRFVSCQDLATLMSQHWPQSMWFLFALCIKKTNNSNTHLNTPLTTSCSVFSIIRVLKWSLHAGVINNWIVYKTELSTKWWTDNRIQMECVCGQLYSWL